MRIAAMAAGAVGGYFGARLAADGHDVFFIARGAHLDAIAKNGLKIESVHGDLHLPKVNVTDDPKAVGPVDVVMFAVKLWDTEKAAELTRPLVGPNTRVITLQNGVDSVERIAPILGADQTMRRHRLYRDGDREARRHQAHQPVRHHAFRPRRQEARCGARCLRRRRQEGQVRHRSVEGHPGRALGEIHLPDRDGGRDRITALLDRPDHRQPTKGKAFFRALMEEARAVGKASGVEVPASYIDTRMEFLTDQGPARHEGLDGARPRARQPARARLAQRQGGGARQAVRRADAGERRGGAEAERGEDGPRGPNSSFSRPAFQLWSPA